MSKKGEVKQRIIEEQKIRSTDNLKFTVKPPKK